MGFNRVGDGESSGKGRWWGGGDDWVDGFSEVIDFIGVETLEVAVLGGGDGGEVVEEEGEDGKKGNKVKESVASREEEGRERRKGEGPLRHERVCDGFDLSLCLR